MCDPNVVESHSLREAQNDGLELPERFNNRAPNRQSVAVGDVDECLRS